MAQFPCPSCGSVLSRVQSSEKRKHYHARYRKCHACGHGYTTVEYPESISQMLGPIVEQRKLLNEFLEKFGIGPNVIGFNVNGNAILSDSVDTKRKENRERAAKKKEQATKVLALSE